jgi:hypothetical protein
LPITSTENINERPDDMTRTGKIARLPQKLRDQLNRRLQDGEKVGTLIEWLNALPEVQKVLQADFGGRPLNHQNLTEWKQGGFREWVTHEESCALVRSLTRRSGDLHDETDEIEISDRLSNVLAAELARIAEVLLDQAKDPRERWDRLREVLQELVRLRKEDHKTTRLTMDRERWEFESGRLEEEQFEREKDRTKTERTASIWAAFHLKSMAQAFGGGEAGEKIAAYLLEVKHDLKPGTLSKPGNAAPAESKSPSPDQAESNNSN